MSALSGHAARSLAAVLSSQPALSALLIALMEGQPIGPPSPIVEARKQDQPVEAGATAQAVFRCSRPASAWAIAGTSTRVRGGEGVGRSWRHVVKGLCNRDDHEDSDGASVLDFWQASAKARELARGDEGSGDKPITVSEAIDAYEVDLKARALRPRTRRKFAFT